MGIQIKPQPCVGSRNGSALSFLVLGSSLGSFVYTCAKQHSQQDALLEHFLCFGAGMACGQSWTPRGVGSPVFQPLHGTASLEQFMLQSSLGNEADTRLVLKPHLGLSSSPVVSCFSHRPKRLLLRAPSVHQLHKNPCLWLCIWEIHPKAEGGSAESYTTGQWICSGV